MTRNPEVAHGLEPRSHREELVLLRAPIARVWQAISDARQFGAWFGVAFDGPFAATGAGMLGRVVPTKADPEVAKTQEPYRGAQFELVVAEIEAPRRFSFRWHPFAVDPAVDYTREEPTLVEFELAEAPDGTRLTITESGFDRIPARPGARRPSPPTTRGGPRRPSLIEKYLARAS